MKTERDYRELQAKLEAIETTQAERAYLADPSVDRENVLVNGMTEDNAEYWNNMYNAAISAAAFRAEDCGINLRDFGISY